MNDDRSSPALADERSQRRAARQIIGEYHEEQLGLLLAHVRDGFVKLDAGQIDAFELDELIHRYKRSAQKLWTFCVTNPGGVNAARHLTWMREHGEEEPDWWAAGEPSHQRD